MLPRGLLVVDFFFRFLVCIRAVFFIKPKKEMVAAWAYNDVMRIQWSPHVSTSFLKDSRVLHYFVPLIIIDVSYDGQSSLFPRGLV